MPTLTLTDQQVLELIRQMPRESQERVFRELLREHWPRWEELSRGGAERLRALARERGLDWDAMREQAREELVDDLVHEDRRCR